MMTTDEFVRLLAKDPCFEQGRKAGWLEEEDELFRDRPITRLAAARILHNFLKISRGETDEAQAPADFREPLDLYDCGKCVNHIFQVLWKGIMECETDEKGQLLFRGRESFDRQQAGTAVRRALNPSMRIEVGTEKTSDLQPERVTREEALNAPDSGSGKVCILDVRSEEEFITWHPKGAVNLPLAKLAQIRDREELPSEAASAETVYVCCENGYLSRLGANALLDLGMKNVRYFDFANTLMPGDR